MIRVFVLINVKFINWYIFFKEQNGGIFITINKLEYDNNNRIIVFRIKSWSFRIILVEMMIENKNLHIKNVQI